MSTDDYRLIEEYFDKKLNKNELASFQVKLETDEAFAQEFVLRKSMNNYLINKKKKAALKEQLAPLGDQYFEGAKVVPIRKRWLRTATSVAAVAVFLILGVPSINSWQQQKAIYKHQPLALVVKSTDASAADKVEKAFNTGDYANAYNLLSQHILENADDQKALLSKGICALELNKTEEAKNIFEGIHSGRSALKDHGTWYLALSYYKDGDEEKCRSYLSQIPENDAYLNKKVKALSNLLD